MVLRIALNKVREESDARSCFDNQMCTVNSAFLREGDERGVPPIYRRDVGSHRSLTLVAREGE